MLFAEHDGTQAASQIKAFNDTWHWDQAATHAYEEFVVSAPHEASQALQAFRSLLGCNDMLAYLSMMAPRIVELHRVLKP
jgi:site-specific DNA-methyltransferase (adenine-specific)